MQVPLQISFHGMTPSGALETSIRRRAAWLERVDERMVSCRVGVELDGCRRRHGRQFNVRVDVKVPAGEVAASRGRDEDVYVALRTAFAAARRQLAERRAAATLRRRVR